MCDYRFYVLRPDNSIESASTHNLSDDKAALAEALKLAKGKPLEGWSGTRLVFRVTADGRQAA